MQSRQPSPLYKTEPGIGECRAMLQVEIRDEGLKLLHMACPEVGRLASGLMILANDLQLRNQTQAASGPTYRL